MDRARRAQPSANAIITKQYQLRVADIHRRKIRSVKPVIDNKPPRPARHLLRNPKREQMREERYARIERENRLLLAKMATILRSNKTLDTMRAYKARSLNKAQRRRKLMKITEENQQILRRIQSSEATYDHVQWEADRRTMEKRMRQISAYDRHGNEKALKAVRSQQRLRRARPQSAPVYKRGGAMGDEYGSGAGGDDDEYEHDAVLMPHSRGRLRPVSATVRTEYHPTSQYAGSAQRRTVSAKRQPRRTRRRRRSSSASRQRRSSGPGGGSGAGGVGVGAGAGASAGGGAYPAYEPAYVGTDSYQQLHHPHHHHEQQPAWASEGTRPQQHQQQQLDSEEVPSGVAAGAHPAVHIVRELPTSGTSTSTRRPMSASRHRRPQSAARSRAPVHQPSASSTTTATAAGATDARAADEAPYSSHTVRASDDAALGIVQDDDGDEFA